MISKKRILGILCILMVAGLVFAGLWPFDPFPKNRVNWLPNEQGLYFDGHRNRWKFSVGGIAYTASPLNSSKPPLSEKGSLTIDIWLRPEKDSTTDVPLILSFADRSGREVLHLGQWKQSLIVRWFRYHQNDKRQMHALGIEDVLIRGKRERITIASDQECTSVYLDGKIVNRLEETPLIGQNASIRGYSITLGNSRKVSGSWTGCISGLKLYERSLMASEIFVSNDMASRNAGCQGLIADFSFNTASGILVPDLSGNGNSLEVPERVTLHSGILGWPYLDILKKGSLESDIVVNVLGFIPLGFLFAFWRGQGHASSRWAAFLLAVLVGAFISLAIEVTQAFIPARDSSMVDVICNTGGAVLGAGIMTARKLGGWEAGKP